ncbi:unnamed protein product [Closterium sp. NIES-64]|nr:unnamed protein product [Closterium sp. NIES-64]
MTKPARGGSLHAVQHVKPPADPTQQNSEGGDELEGGLLGSLGDLPESPRARALVQVKELGLQEQTEETPKTLCRRLANDTLLGLRQLGITEHEERREEAQEIGREEEESELHGQALTEREDAVAAEARRKEERRREAEKGGGARGVPRLMTTTEGAPRGEVRRVAELGAGPTAQGEPATAEEGAQRRQTSAATTTATTRLATAQAKHPGARMTAAVEGEGLQSPAG